MRAEVITQVIKGLLSKHEALRSTTSNLKRKEHLKFRAGGDKNSNINRSVGEVVSNSHEQLGERGHMTSVEEVMTNVVGAARAVELAVEPRDELRLNCCNFIINLPAPFFKTLFLEVVQYQVEV
jgi:hypothetical protein